MESRGLNYKRTGEAFGGAGYAHFLDCSDGFTHGDVKHIKSYTVNRYVLLHTN